MGIIKLNNIRVYTNHGCLKEEALIGSEYRVDLKVEANFEKSCQSDELCDTVDYVQLNRIVKEEMAVRSKLLEHVAQRILDRIFSEVNFVNEATVEVSKINPPIGGDVESVTIVLTEKKES